LHPFPQHRPSIEMELRVESADGFSVPPGCYVGVRVGDVLKQGRYEPQRCYHFPQVERRRNAKIDIYRHVGSCVIAVDPDAKSVHEVDVSSTDPACSAMRLKVNVQSTTVDTGKQREARTTAVKNQAKDYLSKFGIEEKLSEAVKALLKEQPADPTEFLCRHLHGEKGKQSKSKVISSEKISPVQPKKEVAVLPFTEYYKANGIPAAKPDFFSKLYAKFPPAPRSAPPSKPTLPGQDIVKLREQARDVLVKASLDGNLHKALQEVRQEPPPTGNKFTLRPSVGTWLAKTPKPPVKVKVFSKMASVGTWLASNPTEFMEPEPEKKQPCMLLGPALMGPAFYKMGLAHTVRVI